MLVILKNKWLVHSGIIRFNLAISGVTLTGCKIAADNLCPRVNIKSLSAAIVFISTTECGLIEKCKIYLHILKEELVVGGVNIRHHDSQIASGVTDDQNTIRILIIF